MDQAITDGIQHLQLLKEEEEKSSISITISDLLEERTLSLFGRAFKSTLGTAWKMGSDSRIVDMGINDFQFKIYSSYQMEWLPNFCFFGGVLGPVEKHCSGYQAVDRRKEWKKVLLFSTIRWLLVKRVWARSKRSTQLFCQISQAPTTKTGGARQQVSCVVSGEPE
nr:hypothetical protein CFP56_32642 [Quercus suber]